MPEISRFFGIIIRMFFNEHNPPHFHAYYGEEKAEISINSLEVLAGELSGRAYKLVVEWALEHRQELIEDWNRMRNDEQPLPIAPLK